METLRLHQADIEVSALAMGSDLIGSKIDRGSAFNLFDCFHGHGGNFIDTANMYAEWMPGCCGGESETTIGAWMKERGNRGRVVISTKVGFPYPGTSGGLSVKEIERECEKSLKRLQTDVIDIYQAHLDDRTTSLAETMEAFHKLIKSGKVRAVGASNLSLWRIAEANTIAHAQGWSGFALIEQRYTYLRPRNGADFGPQIFITPEVKDYVQVHEIDLVGYSVLLQGVYGRTDREVPAQFAGPEAGERMEALKAVASELSCSPNKVVIAWMRQGTPAILPIIAGSRTEQLEENIAALELTLTVDQLRRLDTAGDPIIERAWLKPS
jgi:aryl-alcohol dehydrogenase-like predicted oxidoreductase